MEWSRAEANTVLPRECTGHSKHPLPTAQEMTLHMDVTRWSIPKLDWLYSLQPKMETLYTLNKNKTGSWLWLRSWTVVQLSSVQSLSHVQFCETPWTIAHQASLYITNSRSPPKPMSIELVMPSNLLILCHPLLRLPSIFSSIRVFSNNWNSHNSYCVAKVLEF